MQEVQALEKEKEKWRTLLETYKEPTVKERAEHVRRLQYEEGQGLFAVAYSTIHKAACDGNVDGLKWFLTGKGRKKGGGDKIGPDDYDSAGNSPIHYASERGHNKAIEYLLKRGSQVDMPTTNGMTPLMFAAKSNKISTMILLYENGAELIAVNKAGMSAIHFAVQTDQIDALKYISDVYDKMVLDAADLVEELKEEYGAGDATSNRKADDNVDLESQGTKASLNSDSTEIKKQEAFDNAVVLLERPPKYALELKSKNGTTPLHMCANFDSRECLKFLIDHKVDVNLIDNFGESALHKAGRKNYNIAYKMMVDAGAVSGLLNHMHEKPSDLTVDEPSL